MATTAETFRRVADFIDSHQTEVEPFRVAVDAAGEVAFHSDPEQITVDQVDDLVTALHGVWSVPRKALRTWWTTSHDTVLGEVTVYASRDVLVAVVDGLPKAWTGAAS